VEVDCTCRPGPLTVLTEGEEEQLATYLVKMADMGFGLCPDTVKGLAFRIVQKSGREHPFQDEKAGRAWFDGFRRRHPRLTIRKPQPLSYCNTQGLLWKARINIWTAKSDLQAYAGIQS